MYVRIALLAGGVLLSACSADGSFSPPAAPSPLQIQNPPPSQPPVGSSTITITAIGVSPTEVTIVAGSRVTFVNSDTRNHEIWGGPDHEHRECPEVDVAGFLVPGQSRETGTFMTAQICQFHDHTNLGNPAYQGRIIVR